MITFDHKEREIWGVSLDLYDLLAHTFLHVDYRNDNGEYAWVRYDSLRATLHMPDPYDIEYQELISLCEEDDFDNVFITYMTLDIDDDEHHTELQNRTG
jgi:hypothetical protein